MIENITLAQVRELLRYEPESGHFFWVAGHGAGRNPDHLPSGGLSSKGYWRLKVGKKLLYAHRLAWFYVHGEWPKGQIDHINGNRTDNRIENLRCVSTTTNAENKRSANKNNKTGLLGTCPDRGLFKACLKVNGKTINLGRFATPEEAQAAYIAAKRIHHVGCTI